MYQTLSVERKMVPNVSRFVNTCSFGTCEFVNQTGVSRRFIWYPCFERATIIDEMVVSFVSIFHLSQHGKHGERETQNVMTLTGTKMYSKAGHA